MIEAAEVTVAAEDEAATEAAADDAAVVAATGDEATEEAGAAEETRVLLFTGEAAAAVVEREEAAGVDVAGEFTLVVEAAAGMDVPEEEESLAGQRVPNIPLHKGLSSARRLMRSALLW